MASTCIHGFAPGTCLICQTLQTAPATATKEAPEAAGGGRAARRAASASAVPAPVRPDAIVARREPHSSHLGLRLLGLLIVAIMVLIVGWLILGFVLSILRIAELVGIAAISGWVGWSLGVRHGRAISRPERNP